MAQAIKTAFSCQIRKFYSQQRMVRNLCNYTKDISKHVQISSTDVLFNKLKNATNTKTVLDMVSMHGGIMNNQHIMQALRSLFMLQKHGNSELSTREILNNQDFRKLCRKLRSQAASIDLNDTVEALKVVSYVGVPSDTTIVQVLLQLIRHNINFLNLQQIIFLDFLLSQFTPGPLVDALKLALPMVFEIQLPVKMEYDSAAHLAEYLFFASKNRLNDATVQRIVNALMANSSDFDSKTAKSIVWSICNMDYNLMFQPLMRKAIDSLIIHFDELNFTDMETTLSKLILRCNRKFPYFYDATFYDSCANYVIDNDLGYKHSLYVLKKFARVNYYHKFLLDYTSKKIYENPDFITKGDPTDIYSIAVATALTDYRPTHWDNLKELIAKAENVANTDRKEVIWIKFAAALCLLDIFKLDVLTKCLHETFLHNLFKKKFITDFDNYATICQCITLFRPDLNCLIPPSLTPELLSKHFRQPLEFPLEAALYKGLGGEKYVKTNLYSKLGHQIDHAIIFRKGGYPVAMNTSDNIEFIEDIEVQPDNQLVVILGLRHFAYTLNNCQMKYSTIIAMKSLESKGCIVIPVCLEIWENLPDFEKIPYLMQAIKEKTMNDSRMSESII